MDVGVISEDGGSFDIAQYEEMNSVISRLDNGATVRTRFVYKDEGNRAVILQKAESRQTLFPRGTRLAVSAAHSGVAMCKHPRDQGNRDVVARLAVPLDFAAANNEYQQRTLEDGTVVYRVPVIVTTK